MAFPNPKEAVYGREQRKKSAYGGRGRRCGGLHGQDDAKAPLPAKAAAVFEGGAERALQDERPTGVS